MTHRGLFLYRPGRRETTDGHLSGAQTAGGRPVPLDPLYCSKDFCGDNGGIAQARQIRRPSRPILFGLTRHHWRRRVLDLDPTIAAAWPVRRSKALRHNALAAERAGQFVDDCAVDFEMAVECDAGLSAAQWPFESSFANLVRLAPQILAIELKQVKSAESDGVVVLPPFRIISNTERPFSPPGDRLAVDYAGSRRETRDSCQD